MPSAQPFPEPTEQRKRDLLEDQLIRLSDDLSVLLKREKEKTRELWKAYQDTAMALALIVEGRDSDTRKHLDRADKWATRVAQRLDLPDLGHLRLGFLLHDIGKWAIPPHILLKPGQLTEEEWKVMRTHPVAGAHMVSDVEFLEKASEVIRAHHEKWDGTGYPYGLEGESIPIGARVFCIADVFDALTSDRPYRSALSAQEAVEMIRAERGKHFDPQVLDAFLEIVEEDIQKAGPEAATALSRQDTTPPVPG